LLQGFLNGYDCAVNSGAIASRCGQENLLLNTDYRFDKRIGAGVVTNPQFY